MSAGLDGYIDASKAEEIARVGWLAKGGLFIVIGILGFELSRQSYGSEDADQRGALASIASAPAGRILVAAVAIGLVLFAVWQLWSAFDTDRDDLLAWAKTAGGLGLAGAYAMLAWTGLHVAVTGRSSSSDGGPGSPEGIAGWLLGSLAGRLSVAAVGCGTVCVAVYHLHKGISDGFLNDIRTEGLERWQRQTLGALGTAGFVARSVVLGVVGYLFIAAALANNDEQAGGLDQSLRTLTELPAGRAILALCAVGLAAAGFYDAATFRRQQIA